MNHDTLYVSRESMQVIAVIICKNRKSEHYGANTLVLCFLLNVYVKWFFIFYYIFVLFCAGQEFLFFCFATKVTLDQDRVYIGSCKGFRVIKCRAYFWASFFHYCLKFLIFSILALFKYFSCSSVESVAAEFQFFYMLYSY